MNSGFQVGLFNILDPFQALPSYTFPTVVKRVTKGCLLGSNKKILSTASTIKRCSLAEVAVVRPALAAVKVIAAPWSCVIYVSFMSP